MNKDIQDRWVAALRGEEYGQGTGVLRSKDDEFCCLGVLCDLVDPDGWDDKGDLGYERTYAGEDVMPPGFIYDQTGLTPEFACRLAQLNDDGYSFDQIADAIEGNNPELP